MRGLQRYRCKPGDSRVARNLAINPVPITDVKHAPVGGFNLRVVQDRSGRSSAGADRRDLATSKASRKLSLESLSLPIAPRVVSSVQATKGHKFHGLTGHELGARPPSFGNCAWPLRLASRTVTTRASIPSGRRRCKETAELSSQMTTFRW
jgi:hypothetical protein